MVKRERGDHLFARNAVFAVPVTEAHSERLYSCIVNAVVKTRNSLSPEYAELSVFVRSTSQVVKKYRVSIQMDRASKLSTKTVCIDYS